MHPLGVPRVGTGRIFFTELFQNFFHWCLRDTFLKHPFSVCSLDISSRNYKKSFQPDQEPFTLLPANGTPALTDNNKNLNVKLHSCII